MGDDGSRRVSSREFIADLIFHFGNLVNRTMTLPKVRITRYALSIRVDGQTVLQ
jgi:hypothetical protein